MQRWWQVHLSGTGLGQVRYHETSIASDQWPNDKLKAEQDKTTQEPAAEGCGADGRHGQAHAGHALDRAGKKQSQRDDDEKLSIRNTFGSVRLSAFRPRVGVYRWGRLHLRYSERGMGRTGGSES